MHLTRDNCVSGKIFCTNSFVHDVCSVMHVLLTVVGSQHAASLTGASGSPTWIRPPAGSVTSMTSTNAASNMVKLGSVVKAAAGFMKGTRSLEANDR